MSGQTPAAGEGEYPAHLEPAHTWDEWAASRYDTPGEGMFAETLIGETVDFLAGLAGTGRALELAVGTGRIAIPLAQRGVRVSGIDYSPAMLNQLRCKPGADLVEACLGDMTQARVEGEFSLVFVVFNSISNVLTQAAQVGVFRNAYHHLAQGGRFVVELFVPELRSLPPGQQAVVFHNEPGYLGVDTYEILTQQLTSHHFTFAEEGVQAEVSRSTHRYIWPAELDLMAQLAGFELEKRVANWRGEPFTAESPAHISVYLKL